MKSLKALLLFVFAACLHSLAAAKEKPHLLNQVVELKLDEEWKLIWNRQHTLGGRIISITPFQTESQGILVFTTIEAPLSDLGKESLDELTSSASEITGHMMEARDRDGNEIRKTAKPIQLRKSKLLKDSYSLFEHELQAGALDPIKVSGVVWKTERRFYCLSTVSKDKAKPATYWAEFADDWRELGKTEKIYAETFPNCARFLTDNQMSQLPIVLRPGETDDEELAALKKKAGRSPSAKARSKIQKRQQLINARKMRQVYVSLLTTDQRKRFEESVERRAMSAK
jgi:hypothetical protein